MAQGHSLHIGLNYINPMSYRGSNGHLPSPINDAKAMERIARFSNFSNIRVLFDEEATLDRVVTEMGELAQNSSPGDLVLISFSGHGGWVPDRDGDETDKKDETWALYDGQLRDDKIFEILQEFEEDVRIALISDSCHSGTIFRNIRDTMPPSRSKEKRAADAEQVKATVQLLAGCPEEETAFAGPELSAFTEALVSIWNEGNFPGNFELFNEYIKKMITADQNPVYCSLGKESDWIENGLPFVI